MPETYKEIQNTFDLGRVEETVGLPIKRLDHVEKVVALILEKLCGDEPVETKREDDPVPPPNKAKW
jgi:hypothetical protein